GAEARRLRAQARVVNDEALARALGGGGRGAAVHERGVPEQDVAALGQEVMLGKAARAKVLVVKADGALDVVRAVQRGVVDVRAGTQFAERELLRARHIGERAGVRR